MPQTQASDDLFLIELEWIPVREAFSYEIEVMKLFKGDRAVAGRYISVSSIWSDRFPVGSYQFKIRSLDYRGVPGPWSDYISFDVNFPNPQIIRPVQDEKVKTSFPRSERVTFQWQPVDGAPFYYLHVKNSEGETAFKDVVKGSKKKVELDTQQTYTWRVEALGSKDGKVPPLTQEYRFYLEGLPLQAPEMIVRYEKNKLRINWKEIDDASGYNIKIFRARKNKWPLVREQKDVKGTSIYFPITTLKKSVYRVSLQASAPDRLDSENSFTEFRWDGSSIDILDEYRPQVESRRMKLEEDYLTKLRNRGPFSAFISLELPQFSYEGVDFFNGVSVSRNLSAQRFTLGMNYNLGRSAYSLGSYFEYTTFLIDDLTGSDHLGQLHLFRGFKRRDWLYFGMLGGFYKKSIFIQLNDQGDDVASNDQINLESNVTAGPTFSVGTRYSITKRLFILGKFDYYLHSVGLSSPDGTEHNTVSTFNFNSWLSYNYDATAQFRLGYSFLKHSISLTQLQDSSGSTLSNKLSTGDFTGNVVRFGFALYF